MLSKPEFLEKKKKEREQSALAQMPFGKLQPQAIEFESAIIGACMLDKDAINNISSLKPIHFYKEDHAKIFQAIIDLRQKSLPIDLLTVTEELRSKGTLEAVGGPFMVIEHTNRVASAANIEYHSRIVMQKFILRRFIALSAVSINNAYDDTIDCFHLIENFYSELYNLTNGVEEGSYSTAKELAPKIIENAKEKYANKSKLSGDRFTKIWELDALISGVEKGDVIGIAGSPSSGKSSIVNAILEYYSENDEPVLMWSGEMTKIKSATRLLAAMTNIGTRKIQQGKFLDSEQESSEVMSGLEKMSENVYFQSDQKDIKAIISDVKKFKRKGVKLFIYDRSELLENDYSNDKDLTAYGNILKRMRILAAQEQVAFIVLIQTTAELAKNDGVPSMDNVYGKIAVTSSFNKIIGIINPYSLQMQDFPLRYSDIHNNASPKGHIMINVVKSNDGDDLNKPILLKMEQSTNTIRSIQEPMDDFYSAINERTNDDGLQDIPF